MTGEPPNTVHGRLLEAVHLSGYSFERACAELEWLLDEDRWKRVGAGYEDINAFLGSIDFSEFRVALDQRKKLARRLQSIEASQRATARLLGVHESTVREDLGKRKPAGNPAPAHDQALENQASVEASAGNPAWFQADVDPSQEAKRVTSNQRREDARAQNRDERLTQPLPAGSYRLLYADPPWRYEHIETESRAIENQYPTMALDDICALKVPAADDAVLYLWATSPKLAEAIDVIKAWRFVYRTCAVWDKETIGMGYYFRQRHELLLVAARGALPVPAPSDRPASVITAKRGRHSEKPAVVYELLEGMYPTFTARDRIELFNRTARPGWAQWGNETGIAV